MKQKTYRFSTFIIVIIVVSMFVGCQNNKNSSYEGEALTTIPTSNDSDDRNNDYLSITYTEYVNGQNTQDGMVMHVSTYHIQSGTLHKISDIPYTSQYPLSVLSKADNKLYYSADVDDKGDQLFAYDLNAQTIQQLSNDFFAINHIVPTTTEGPLIVVLVKKGFRNLQTAFFDKQSGVFHFLDEDDKDTSTWVAAYNSERNKTYLAQFSDKEDYDNMLQSNEAQTRMVPAKRTVVEVDHVTMQTRKIIELEKEQIMGISARNDQLFLVTSPEFNRPPVEYSLVDIETGERTMLDLPIITRSDAFLDHEEKGIYLLGGSSDPNDENGRGIYYYEFDSQKLHPILLQKDGSFINNFLLMSHSPHSEYKEVTENTKQ